MAQRRVTLQDIADELGITKGTVDRALHNRPGVSPETRRRVLELMDRRGYKPDRVAQSLSLRARKLRVGVLFESAFSPFWGEVERGIHTAAEEFADFGLEVVCQRTGGERNAVDILAGMDALLAQEVDAIALVPVDNPAVCARIDETVGRGVLVATFNDDLPASRRLFYVGPQIRQSGRVAGELLRRMLRGRGRLFVVRIGIPSFEYDERLAGFHDYLRERCPGMVQAGEATCGPLWPTHPAEREAFLQALTAAGPLDGIYDTTGSYLGPIARVVQGIPAFKGTVLVGHELSPEVAALLEEDAIAAVISQDPFSQGYTVVRRLFECLRDDAPPPWDRQYTRLDIVMRENLTQRESIIINPH